MLSSKQTTRKVPLQRVVTKKKDETKICAFDFETRGLGGEFIVGAFATSDNIRCVCYSLLDCLEFILRHPEYRFLAHNASGYEFCYLYPHIKRYFDSDEEVELIITLQGESKIVQIRIKRGKQTIDLRDTLCLFGTSLAKVATSYCPELPKLSGTIDFEREHFAPTNEQHMSYLWRDCDIILLAYRKLADMVWKTFHCNLGVTAGRTAMNAYTSSIEEGKKYWRLNKYVEEFIRNAYYGAAVFPGHKFGNWGETTSVDINGAYAYQMGSNPYPVGTAIRTLSYVQGSLGVYRVLVSVPKSLYTTMGFNPIPCKSKNGLIWETGIFETYTTSIEIEWCRARGVTFEILDGYVWYKSEYVFKEFVDKCQEFELADAGAYKPAIKLLRNSCYGKFGTKTIHKELIFSHRGIPKFDCSPIINGKTGEQIDGLFTSTNASDSPYILPHWAAFITAYQRLYLFNFIEAAYKMGSQSVYCDTDSLKCESSVVSDLVDSNSIPLGNLYGQFKIELKTDNFIMIGPKTYYMSDKEMKAKGMPFRKLGKEMYEQAVKGNRTAQSFDAVRGLFEMVKTCNYSLPIIRSRTMSNIYNSAAWELASDSNIYPRGWWELDEEALYA